MVNSLDKFKRKGTTHEDFYTTKELTEDEEAKKLYLKI